MSSGKNNLKQQDVTAHLLEWPNFRTLKTEKQGSGARETHSMLVGMQNNTLLWKIIW